MVPYGRRDGWLTAAVIAMLLWRAIRGRWRRVGAIMRQTGVRAPHQGCDGLTAEDRRRLTAWAARARRGEPRGDDRYSRG